MSGIRDRCGRRGACSGLPTLTRSAHATSCDDRTVLPDVAYSPRALGPSTGSPVDSSEGRESQSGTGFASVPLGPQPEGRKGGLLPSASPLPSSFPRSRGLGLTFLLEPAALRPHRRILQRFAVGLLHEPAYPCESGFHNSHAIDPLRTRSGMRGRRFARPPVYWSGARTLVLPGRSPSGAAAPLPLRRAQAPAACSSWPPESVTRMLALSSRLTLSATANLLDARRFSGYPLR